MGRNISLWWADLVFGEKFEGINDVCFWVCAYLQSTSEMDSVHMFRKFV